jgi:protoporphyrinogen oxidase
MGRITNFRNWVPSLYGEERGSILALEYWANHGDALWGMDSDWFIELGTRELRSTGLIGNAPVVDGHVVKIPRCYPVYERGYKQTLKPVEEYLNRIEGLQVIGRYGAFKYNNQDHSILMGLLAAANISEGASHNLWEINSDCESYQEAARITETGLVAISES